MSRIKNNFVKKGVGFIKEPHLNKQEIRDLSLLFGRALTEEDAKRIIRYRVPRDVQSLLAAKRREIIAEAVKRRPKSLGKGGLLTGPTKAKKRAARTKRKGGRK